VCPGGYDYYLIGTIRKGNTITDEEVFLLDSYFLDLVTRYSDLAGAYFSRSDITLQLERQCKKA
jgi:hypothetical protein